MSKCIVYKLTNKVNKKFYIGQTWRSLENRFGRNGNGYSNSPKLYFAIKKYGVENFEYSILYKAECQQEADAVEEYFIKKLSSQNNGYNIKNGGRGGKHSKQSKLKIRNTLINKYKLSKKDEENIAKLYKSGSGLRKTANAFKTSISKVCKILNKHDIQIRRAVKLSPNKEIEVINLYTNSNLRVCDITKKYKISSKTFYNILNKHNIECRNLFPNSWQWKGHNNKIHGNQQKIINMYNDDNYTIYDIRKVFNIGREKIYQILISNNITIKEKNSKLYYDDIYRDILKNNTYEDVVKKYDISRVSFNIIKDHYKL